MNRKIKIWLGTTELNEEEYSKYFELDYETEDFDDPNYKICGFCKDIGDLWYNEDFIGIVPVFEKKISVDKLISETPLTNSSKEQLKSDCLKMGIEFGNAILFYSGNTRGIAKGEIFNGLKYIGEYDI